MPLSINVKMEEVKYEEVDSESMQSGPIIEVVYPPWMAKDSYIIKPDQPQIHDTVENLVDSVPEVLNEDEVKLTVNELQCDCSDSRDLAERNFDDVKPSDASAAMEPTTSASVTEREPSQPLIKVSHCKEPFPLLHSALSQLTSEAGASALGEKARPRSTKTRRDKRPFKCNRGRCKKAFKCLDHLRKHIRSHDVRRFYCPHCDMIFTEGYRLKRHLASKGHQEKTAMENK